MPKTTNASILPFPLDFKRVSTQGTKFVVLAALRSRHRAAAWCHHAAGGARLAGPGGAPLPVMAADAEEGEEATPEMTPKQQEWLQHTATPEQLQ